MIKDSFAILDGIGQATERILQQRGIHDWDDFLHTPKISGISPKRRSYYNRQLLEAQKALAQGELGFFIERLPSREMWRLYPHFKDACCFLDVEVDSHGKLIVLTLFDRFESKTMVRGVNLEKEIFEREISRYKILVTYNGSAFDIPKIEKQLKTTINVPHIDLKPLCQRLGLQGGLKDIEQQMGISRPAHLRGHPIDAWKAFWASGDKEWLELLVKYNEEDAVNLYQLMEKCMVRVMTTVEKR